MGQFGSHEADAPSWRKVLQPHYIGGGVTSIRHKTWSGVSAYVKQLRFKEPFRAEYTSDCSRFIMMLDFVGDRSNVRHHPSRPTPVTIDTIHQMQFIPAGTPTFAHSDGLRYMRHITMSFDIATIGGLLDEGLDLRGLSVPRLMFHDPVLYHLARLFEIECESDGPTDLLYGDSLSLALLLRLASIARSGSKPTQPGGLTAVQLRRVTSYIDDHLAEDILLRDFAELTQLSRSYFSCAFRLSTGLSPHRWLLARRVERAKEHLMAGVLPLAEIALQTGFADQAHFTRTFTRLIGLSPTAWRRQQIR